jgi:hypothetical protein
MDGKSSSWSLRQLPLPVRLVLAAFLLSVGLGYLAALAQLKMQIAQAGAIAPTAEDAVGAYHGTEMSQLVRLLEADETRPFNGQGSMRSAFTRKRSAGWDTAVRKKGKELQKEAEEKGEKFNPTEPANLKKLNELIAQERDGERRALLDWLKTGKASREEYENGHPLTGELATAIITTDFVDEKQSPRVAKIKEIIEKRCLRCHSTNVGGAGSNYPLDEYEDIEPYTVATPTSGMSLPKLAQTTHVHLLGFSMLWGLTGLIFAFTSYPTAIRLLFSPWTVVAQIVDITCWWLSRLEGANGAFFARAIVVTGGLVAMGLTVQVLGSLFNMFGKGGKVIVLLLLLAGALGLGGVYLQVIEPYLQSEVASHVTGK